MKKRNISPYAQIHYGGGVFEVKDITKDKNGRERKRCKCVGSHGPQKCGLLLTITVNSSGNDLYQFRGECVCNKTLRLARGPNVIVPDNRPMFKMSAYPLGMAWPDPKKYDLLLNAAEQKDLKHALTGSLSADRFYVPNLYAENIPAEGLNLRTSVEFDFSYVFEYEKRINPHLQYHHVGLIGSNPEAVSQGKLHFDYPGIMRRRSPDRRGISLIMAIHGFEFCYLTEAKVWVRIWVPEGHYVSFTGECFHFGGSNPFRHRILRAFAALVSDPEDFPNNTVFSPSAGFEYPDPHEVGTCGPHQDMGRHIKRIQAK